jgi:endonuclease VIII
MPEGHTLHALARRLERAFAGAPVQASSPQGRFVEGAALLDGRVLCAASAWGKHLFVEFEGDAWLHVHLGLIGHFPVVPLPPEGSLPVRGQVRLRLLGRTHVADLRGPNLCAVVAPEEVDAVMERLGPDPLRPAADPEQAWRRISRSSKPIAELLMDQAVVAGIGNVYRCELLYRHRVDPFRPGREIRARTWRALWEDMVMLLPLGVAFGQILTVEEQVRQALAEVAAGGVERHTASLTGEGLGDFFERRFYVYRRAGEPCLVCGARIRTAPAAGRNLFWCGRCQRRR